MPGPREGTGTKVPHLGAQFQHGQSRPCGVRRGAPPADERAPGSSPPARIWQGRTRVRTRVLAPPDYVFPVSTFVTARGSLSIRPSGDPAHTVWLAPAGTTNLAEASNMNRASGDQTTIAVPVNPGTHKLSVVDSLGHTLGESEAALRVE